MMGDTPLARVRVLTPLGGDGLDAFLARRPSGASPFSQDRLDAIAAFSARLLKTPAFREDPACVAAAFWMRKANLHAFRAAFEARSRPDLLWVPAGRVFHVAPSNVDTLFLYSWAIAFLCGNASVVRVSQNLPPAVRALLRALDQTAAGHPVLADGNRFVTYDHDDEVSAIFSRWCSHRIVWGGDATVEALRRVPLNPHASERSFASKFSSALFHAGRYLAATDSEREEVARAFFNDFFGFDQAACSTPQVLFWAGSPEEARAATARFLDALQGEAERRGHTVDPARANRRINHAFDLAIRAESRVDLGHPALVAVEVLDLRDLDKEICGGGFLRIVRVPSPEAVLPFLDERDQTITHFGFTEGEVRDMGRAFAPTGIDRLVPVGEALAFDPVWDGFDLMEDCLRRVSVRARA
jgi:hypothetical protein